MRYPQQAVQASRVYDLCRRQCHAFKGGTAEALKDAPAGPEQAIIPPIIGQGRKVNRVRRA